VIFIKSIENLKNIKSYKEFILKVIKEKKESKFFWRGGSWGWDGKVLLVIFLAFCLCLHSGVRGGGKCPEEEHTTCSGGPTINCHKRGLWGREYFIIKYSRKCEK
jgi:hypothetical protein